MVKTLITKGADIKIFSETKELVKKEKEYTKKILKNLMVIEKDKLFCDLKYPSLYKYLIKELGYTDAEAMIRVNAVRLMLKSKIALKSVEEDKLTLSNAAEANKAIKKSVDRSPEKIDFIIKKATESSARVFKEFVRTEIEKRREELLRLDEHMLDKLDRMRKKLKDDSLSNYELVQILLEKELKDPNQIAQNNSKKLSASNRQSCSKKLSASNRQSCSKKLSASNRQSCSKNPDRQYIPKRQNSAIAIGEMRSGQLEKNKNLQINMKTIKVSRNIPIRVKREVYSPKCFNCSNRYHLEYDHRMKFSHGGGHDPPNIQILCRACNQRKEIKARQLNLFA